MNVLLACPGIYQEIGDTQRVYEHVIRNNPAIEFYFLGDHRPRCAMPHNAHYLPLTDIHRRQLSSLREEAQEPGGLLGAPGGRADDLALLLDLAASVPPQHFDILDIPDSLAFAVYLPAMIREFGVDFGKTALSLHGTPSMRRSDNWTDHGADLATLREHEELLYRWCDIRYGLGRQYLADWQTASGLSVRLLDIGELRDLADGAPFDAWRETEDTPALCFIGEPDRCAGPDLFLELCSRLPRELFSDVRLYRPQSCPDDGEAMAELRRMARHRSLDLVDEAIAPESLVARLRSERIVAVLPSRDNSFNIFAVEALRNGCPAVISTRSGASDFLESAYPGVPHIKVDPDDLLGCYGEIVALLTDYDSARVTLGKRLPGARSITDAASLAAIYAGDAEPDPVTRGTVDERFRTLAAQLDAELARPAERAAAARCPTILSKDNDPQQGETDFAQAIELNRIWRESSPLAANPEWDPVDLALERLRAGEGGVNRLHLYRLMAQWERGRGNPLLYAAYWLRIMRLSGRLPPDVRDEVTAVLAAEGHADAVAAAMLLLRNDEEEIYAWLDRRRSLFRCLPNDEHASVIEINRPASPKISIITAVHNDAGKIGRFSAAIERLSDEELAICEFIFVGRGSIDDSSRLLQEQLHRWAERGIGGLCLEGAGYQTVGAAWNRGVAAARGDYIACLGLDEAIRPLSLAALAGCLDRRLDVDWAQGNAISIDIDRDGAYLRDTVAAHRDLDRPAAYYLDPGYIGHLGALYRKAVHDRVGFYDPSLRIATADEFVSRALPFMHVETLPEALGTAAEERDTASVLIGAISEIEELCARDLHRTPGGIRFAFCAKSADECLSQFRRALDFRRSDGTAPCTDIDYAWNMAEYLQRYRPEVFAEIEQLVPGLAALRLAYRRLDDLADPQTSPGVKGVTRVAEALRRAGSQITEASKAHASLGLSAVYHPRHDYRWMQDRPLWQSAAFSPVTEGEAKSLATEFTLAREIDLSRPIGGAGWYPAEGSDSHWHRWTGPDPEFKFDMLLSNQLSYRSEILLAPIRPAAADELSLRVNGTAVAHVEEWAGEALQLSFPVMRTLDRSASGTYRITIRHNSVYAPAESGETSDPRRLGFAVRSIRFVPLPRKPAIDAPLFAAEAPPIARSEDNGDAAEVDAGEPSVEAIAVEGFPSVEAANDGPPSTVALSSQ